jgi:hypothetical protein
MILLRRAFVTGLLASAMSCGYAQETPPDCWRDEVAAHVQLQFEIYGPKSTQYEYFGFIYRLHESIGSAVTRSSKCQASGNCTLDTRHAAQRIPAHAKVLGEWHTHSRNGSMMLSELDVRGAYGNRGISCYAAFFANPAGRIYAWDPRQTSVPTAMHSLHLLGEYRQKQDFNAVLAASHRENVSAEERRSSRRR